MSDASKEPDAANAKPCPTCRKPVERSSETFPFCSKRCRLVDLGKWFDESYKIPTRPQDE